MDSPRSLLFRGSIEAILKKRGDCSPLLLHADDGYLFFSTPSLHARYGGAGSGYWQDIQDLFFFTISFGVKNKGYELELWLYGDQDVRKAALSRVVGREGLEVLETMKGHEKLYRLPFLTPAQAAKGKADAIQAGLAAFSHFLDEGLPRLEKALLR